MITNYISGFTSLASFSAAFWFGDVAHTDAAPFGCHHIFETSYVYQAIVNVDAISMKTCQFAFNDQMPIIIMLLGLICNDLI